MTASPSSQESAVSAAAVGAAFTERIGLLPPANRCRESSRPLILVSPVTEYFSRKEEQHILSLVRIFSGSRHQQHRNWNLQTLAPIEIGLDSTA